MWYYNTMERKLPIMPEQPEVATGPAPEQTRTIGRREFLGFLAGAVVGAYAHQLASDSEPNEGVNTQVVDVLGEHNTAHSPERKESDTLPDTIDMLVIGDPISDREHVETIMRTVQDRFRETIGWDPAWNTQTIGAGDETYTLEGLKSMVKADRSELPPEEQQRTITGIINGKDTRIDIGHRGGFAYPKEGLFIVDGQTSTGWKTKCIAHEIGHVLGLPHPGELSTTLTDESDDYLQYGKLGTIQELINENTIKQPLHYGEATGDNQDGEPDQYTVPVTVMGNHPLDILQKRVPILSPPEILFLDDRRKAETYGQKSLPNPDQKIALSYREDDTFAALLELPSDHILRQVLPNAKSICFGPTITSFSEDNLPFDDRRSRPQIGAFVIDENGHDTTQLNIGIFTKIDNDGDGKEVVLYADEQLDTVAVAGRMDDSNDPYVRFLPLSGEGGHVLKAEKARTEERNKILLDPA